MKKKVALGGIRTRDPWFTRHISNREVPSSSPSEGNMVFSCGGNGEFFLLRTVFVSKLGSYCAY